MLANPLFPPPLHFFFYKCLNAPFRYGYNMLTIARPKLYSILLSRIPAYKILFNKRVVFASQTHEGVKVRCEDGSTVSGDILVAADGGASPIRTAMYEEIRKRCKKVPHPSDYSIPKMDQRVIVGVTEPQSTKQFPVLDSKDCELILMMPKQSNCMVGPEKKKKKMVATCRLDSGQL